MPFYVRLGTLRAVLVKVPVHGEYAFSCLNLTAAQWRLYVVGQEAQFRGSDFPKVSQPLFGGL